MSKIKEQRKEQIKSFLSDPELLLQKRPFVRGGDFEQTNNEEVSGLSTQRVKVRKKKYKVISQQTFLNELDPSMHTVLYDDNVPHICVKAKGEGLIEIQYKKMSLPYQVNIKNKKVLHLCGNPVDFTLLKQNPTEEDTKAFLTFKQYWQLRNMNGIRTKFVDAQMSVGDAGALFYKNYKGEIKCRILSFLNGYTLCPHNDANGDRLIESIYYTNEDDREVIDSWDDTMHYRHINYDRDSDTLNGWTLVISEAHGFSEIPFITKRGKVAWDKAQSVIETFEIMYNIFTVIQKRHGWGILYIKGKFKPMEETMAGSVILNDTDPDGKGSAEFKTPPNPNQMIEFLKELKYEIQTAGGATFILPQDVKMSGDVSALAIQLSQAIDNEEALRNVIDWQNVASKMCRLFKEGLAQELVNKEIDKKAITKYSNLDIDAQFKVWSPKSDVAYNQMLGTMYSAGMLSQQSVVELNTESKPDEINRILIEKEKAAEEELQAQTNITESTETDDDTSDTNTNNDE